MRTVPPGVSSLVVLAALALAPYSHAGSRLIFPRISFEPDSITGLALVNPNSAAVEVSVSAYSSDGKLLDGAGVVNPRMVSIPPAGQFADLVSNLFAGGVDPETVGWMEATAAADGITGFFLYLTVPGLEALDGADLPLPARQIVFPDVRIEGGFSTEINLLNPEYGTADVELKLYQAGTVLSTLDLTLPGKGILRSDVSELFGLELPAGGGAGDFYLLASGSAPLAGFEFVRGNGDLLGLNARDDAERLERLFFPQMAVGGPIRTELTLYNRFPSGILVTVRAHRENGALFAPPDVSENPVTLNLAAREVRTLDVGELFGFDMSGVNLGWLEVESSSMSLNGSLSYAILGLGSLAAVASSRSGTTRAVFSHLATDQGFFTGLAALNPGAVAANLRVAAMRPDGSLLGSVTTTLAPGQRIAQLIGADIIPQAAGQAGGLVWVQSNVPVFLTSLFGTETGTGVLANIPPQPVPAAFNPLAGQTQPRISPPLAVVEPSGQLNLSFLPGEQAGDPVWQVVGGDGAGMISASGGYQAPALIPAQLPVVVTATVGGQSASTSIDILARDVLVGGLGQVQSVAYLSGLKRLYVAEISGLGAQGAAGLGPQQTASSTIVDVTDQRTTVRTLSGEDVSKLIPFSPDGALEYLLLAGRATGQILRLEPQSNTLTAVASQLNAPSAMVLDPATGDLLVAEADRISIVPASQLQASQVSLVPTGEGGPGPAPPPRLLLGEVAPTGIAVDSCTGDILFSEASTGSVIRFSRQAGALQIETDGLAEPGQMLALYRREVSCPESFHLLVADPGAGRVVRIVPSEQLVQNWLGSPGIRDLAFLPSGNPFGLSESVLLGERVGMAGQIVDVEVPRLYGVATVNPLPDGLVVANTNDSGYGSLRRAINDANATGGSAPPIVFRIPTSDPGYSAEEGTFTIRPQSPLPLILNFVLIDGESQRLFGGDTNPYGPEIVLNGAKVGGSALRISGDFNSVTGLVINGFGMAIEVTYSPDGTPSFNRFARNYIGTDASGSSAVPNFGDAFLIRGFGSAFSQARQNVVEQNLISGNNSNGLILCDAAETHIFRNFIGTDRTGVNPLPNRSHGIALVCAGDPANLIEENRIAFNGRNGFYDQPDYNFPVGLTEDGHQRNQIRRNTIYSNGRIGINFLPPPSGTADEVTPNDNCDGDVGGNKLQNFPVIQAAETDGQQTVIAGTLNSAPNQSFEVELFASSIGEGPRGGELFLDTTVVMTDGSCNGMFMVMVPVGLTPGSLITATATDSAGNTSEFSDPVAVTGGGQ